MFRWGGGRRDRQLQTGISVYQSFHYAHGNKTRVENAQSDKVECFCSRNEAGW